MYLDFCENGQYLTFCVTEEGSLRLLHYGLVPFAEESLIKPQVMNAPAVELQIAGGNPNAHHGGKHFGTSGCTTLRYVSHKITENCHGKHLELIQEDAQLRVTSHYQFYAGVQAMRTWTVAENICNEPVGLEYITSLVLNRIAGTDQDYTKDVTVWIPYSGVCAEVGWKQHRLTQLGLDEVVRSSKRISIANTGTWSAKEYLPMGAVSNPGTNQTVLWQIEHNGSWHWELADKTSMLYLNLSGPTERENGWFQWLQPGECFETVTAAVCIAANFGAALQEMTKYRRRIVRPNPADAKLPVIFNDYMNCLWASPTTEKELPMIDLAAELGAEYYCMDAGWYAEGAWWDTVGCWEPCAWRFPGGMGEVFDHIRARGMVPGIWLEIESMGINCPIQSEFPDECFFMRHGKKVIDHGRYQLDFRHPKVREFATSVVERLIRDYGIGYFKLDYNIDGGLGTEVDADSAGAGLLGHNRAYLNWIQSIMDRHPTLIIENCSSGGMRMDYAQLALHSIQSVTDQTSYRRMIPIAANVPTALLPEQAAIWSYPLHTEDDWSVCVNMANSMLSRIHLSGGVHQLSPKQVEEVKEGVACYKAIRSAIPASLPVLPEGLNHLGDGWMWSGRVTDDSVYLQVWRTEDSRETFCICWDALGRKGREATVLYPTHKDVQFAVTETGLEITLPATWSAAVLRVDL